MVKRLVSIVCVFSSLVAMAVNDTTAVDWRPQFHATLKPRLEVDPADGGAARFQVRNARFGAVGNITRSIDYKVEMDLCDRGKIKLLDCYAGFKVLPGLQLQLGQILIPFGIDAPRANYDYIFGDFSFVGMFNGAIRGCGAKAIYDLPGSGLKLAGAVYNNYEMTEQTVWQKSMSFALEGRYSLGPVTPVVGFESSMPGGIRINSLDAALLFVMGRWQVEGEYMMKHYTHRAFKTAHAFNIHGRYTMPIKAGVFNRLTFEGRFDGMTNYSNGNVTDGRLSLDASRCKRASVGATIGHVRGPLLTYFRLDYYHTFHPRNVATVATDPANKIIAEVVLHF